MAKSVEHYVDNQKFLTALLDYRVASDAACALGQDRPQIPEYVGECFLKIATHLSYKPNFINYTFRDDMISDGVENCLIYVHNFNPEKSNNPFGYFTQIIYFAFVRRIQREKKHQYIRCKLIEQTYIDGGAYEAAGENGIPILDTSMLSFDNVKDFINRYDDYAKNRRERRRQAKQTRETV